MKCPYCQNEMVEGFIRSSRSMWFTDDQKGNVFISAARFGDIPLSEKNWTAPRIKAFYCDACKKIVIDVKKLPLE